MMSIKVLLRLAILHLFLLGAYLPAGFSPKGYRKLIRYMSRVHILTIQEQHEARQIAERLANRGLGNISKFAQNSLNKLNLNRRQIVNHGRPSLPARDHGLVLPVRDHEDRDSRRSSVNRDAQLNGSATTTTSSPSSAREDSNLRSSAVSNDARCPICQRTESEVPADKRTRSACCEGFFCRDCMYDCLARAFVEDVPCPLCRNADLAEFNDGLAHTDSALNNVVDELLPANEEQRNDSVTTNTTTRTSSTNSDEPDALNDSNGFVQEDKHEKKPADERNLLLSHSEDDDSDVNSDLETEGPLFGSSDDEDALGGFLGSEKRELPDADSIDFYSSQLRGADYEVQDNVFTTTNTTTRALSSTDSNEQAELNDSNDVVQEDKHEEKSDLAEHRRRIAAQNCAKVKNLIDDIEKVDSDLSHSEDDNSDVNSDLEIDGPLFGLSDDECNWDLSHFEDDASEDLSGSEKLADIEKVDVADDEQDELNDSDDVVQEDKHEANPFSSINCNDNVDNTDDEMNPFIDQSDNDDLNDEQDELNDSNDVVQESKYETNPFSNINCNDNVDNTDDEMNPFIDQSNNDDLDDEQDELNDSNDVVQEDKHEEKSLEDLSDSEEIMDFDFDVSSDADDEQSDTEYFSVDEDNLAEQPEDNSVDEQANDQAKINTDVVIPASQPKTGSWLNPLNWNWFRRNADATQDNVVEDDSLESEDESSESEDDASNS